MTGLWVVMKSNLRIESTSANNYKLSTDAFSINDYSISTFLYTEILAGKKANDSISIYKSTLEENDIDKIEKNRSLSLNY